LAGYRVVVIDDLSAGFRWAVQDAELIHGSIGDRDLLERCLVSNSIDAVMHFAGSISVSESMQRPNLYYRNNLANTLTLLDAMNEKKINRLIFSSTAAIFGDSADSPLDELYAQNPMNPYGRSKWMVEHILDDYDVAFALKSVCLRYFNAAGADPEGTLGECHDPETHLIPLVLQVASGRRPSISVFGDNYPTKDGTCIRDYIHVEDLCTAHLLALEHLLRGGDSSRFNLGNGRGFSVREVIEAAKRVTRRPIPVEICPPRTGDSAI
jgi:UDP-glucose-4-epimerase